VGALEGGHPRLNPAESRRFWQPSGKEQVGAARSTPARVLDLLAATGSLRRSCTASWAIRRN
jgi:hypothetical protein